MKLNFFLQDALVFQCHKTPPVLNRHPVLQQASVHRYSKYMPAKLGRIKFQNMVLSGIITPLFPGYRENPTFRVNFSKLHLTMNQ